MNINPAGKRFEYFDGKCAIKGCNLPELAAGFCNKHWRRNKKYGSPLWLAMPAAGYRGLSAPDRFFPRVAKSAECWNWQSGTDNDGYGLFMGEVLGVTFKRAHRFSWAYHNNQIIPDSMTVMHSCDNPRCVNPSHLSLGTQCENQKDKWRKGRGWTHKGTSHWSTNLTEDQVREIRSSTETQKSLGERFGMKQSSISAIVRRKSWRHIA